MATQPSHHYSSPEDVASVDLHALLQGLGQVGWQAGMGGSGEHGAVLTASGGWARGGRQWGLKAVASTEPRLLLRGFGLVDS